MCGSDAADAAVGAESVESVGNTSSSLYCVFANLLCNYQEYIFTNVSVV